MPCASRSPCLLALAALAALACAFTPASALGVPSKHAGSDLSPRLEELAKPSVRTAPPLKQAARLSVAPRGPGSLLREGNRVLVDVRFDRGVGAGVDDLREVGAEIVNVSRRYRTVTVAARPAELRDVAAVPRVEGVVENLAPMTFATCPSGDVVSEGDDQLNAAAARDEFGVDGTGVTVGVLSDSFDQDTEAPTSAADDTESGDLPGGGNPCGHTSPTNVLDDSGGTDEGRAMAQIVHDLAPGADLAFATAFKGHLSFAENIERLARPVGEGGAGAKAIVDDVIYFVEPFFQEGPVAVAADNVTAEGASYFSSAGNSNLIDASGRDIASWEAPEFRLAATCPPELTVLFPYVTECMDFDPDLVGSDPTFGMTVADGAALRVDLQWAEPWDGVDTDLDVYLLDEDGDPVLVGGEAVRSEAANVEGTQRPFEFLFWENETGSAQNVQLAINRYTGAGGGGTDAPRVKFVLLQNGGGVTATEYPESSGGDTVGPTVFGHAGAESAIAVGAVRYNNDSKPEFFSSRGPVSHYFGPVDGTTPAEPLEPAQTLTKPDLVATNGGVNTFFGSPAGEGIWRFFGTSASAPHAAAVAALMRDADPSLTPDRLREELESTARPVGEFGPNAIGAGLVDAMEAVGAVALPSEEGDEPTSKEEDEPSSPDDSAEADAPPPAVPPPPIVNPDLVAPHTFIKKRPRKVVFTPWRRGRAVFKFRSNEVGVLFFCQFDRKRWRRCGPRFVRWFLPGRHVLRVKARDAAGNVDPTPAVYRFRVRRVSKQQFASLRRASRRARHDRR